MNSTRLCHSGPVIWGLAIILIGVKSPALIAQTTPINFKIAFIGDQGSGREARAVLNLIKNEGAAAVVHSGDFDYHDNPQAWDNLITSILGANFPYFASIGNHDDSNFYGPGGYQFFMAERMNRLGITWNGDLGVQSSFKYNGIFFVLTAPDVTGSGHDIYIREVLAADSSVWSISSWHKNMRLMQVGSKSNETGWEVYEESRKGGAIIATAHEHSYSRTHLLSSCQSQTVASFSDTLILTKDNVATPQDEGRSFVFVSGLGGNSIRAQKLSGNWWASIYTSTQGANHGALFGTFNANGVPNRAEFYFKDINGVVPDSFVVISNVLPPPIISSFSPTSGSFGTRVTINGNNFTSATEVAFNGVAASNFIVESKSQIRAEVPADATTGKLSITALGGTALSTKDFTVTFPPSISAFTPTFGLAGTQVTIIGDRFNGATQVAFNGVGATTFTVDSETQISAKVSADATTGKISVTKPEGTATSTKDFIVVAPPATNLARNKPATVSSTKSSYTAKKAVDGSTSTYWSSAKINSENKTQWLRLDLQSAQIVGRAVVKWKSSYYAQNYQLQVSIDDANWTTVYNDSAGTGSTQNFTFPQTPARYVQLYMTLNKGSYYRVKELEVYSGAVAALTKEQSIDMDLAATPDKIALEQNYPNPFNPLTSISYSIVQDIHVSMKIYNITGQEMATLVDGYHNSGNHSVVFDASGLPSGIYFTVLEAGAERLVRRIVLIK
ncbi:discoidin domain-containing protein [candidate division KSB1 bacterium]|nr:discoidin domain-containing protein [candidate division KSB1 bacterium]